MVRINVAVIEYRSNINHRLHHHRFANVTINSHHNWMILNQSQFNGFVSTGCGRFDQPAPWNGICGGGLVRVCVCVCGSWWASQGGGVGVGVGG